MIEENTKPSPDESSTGHYEYLKNGIVEVPIDINLGRKLNFLVDTGSDISLINEDVLDANSILNQSDVIDINGIFSKGTTLGTIEANILLDPPIKCKLHVTEKIHTLDCDGILGQDILFKYTNIEGPNRLLKFLHTECQKQPLNATVPKNALPIVRASQITPSQGDEIHKKAVDSVNSVSKSSSHDGGSIKSIGLDKNNTVICKITADIPPRSEIFLKCPINLAEGTELLCHSHEISPQIYVASSLTEISNGSITLGVANVSTSEVSLQDIPIQLYSSKLYTIRNLRREKSNTPQKSLYSISAKNTNKHNERIRKLFEALSFREDLNPEERSTIAAICEKFSGIFQLDEEKLPYTNAIYHKIQTENNKGPINTKQYRLPEAHRRIISEHVKQMHNDNIISDSKSPWNSPLLVVPKKADKDGVRKYRVVVDFRKINDITIGDAFPLPRIDDILDQLGNSRYFSTLDLASGYHQVKIEKADRQKTAFSTSTGHYEFNRMPFGLKGAPATFQRLMNHILSGLQGIKCFVYLDDIVVYGRNLEDHNRKLVSIFERIEKFNLRLQPRKCNFLQREVVYLGYKITELGVLPDDQKIKSIVQIPSPTNPKETQSFLGMVNFYRRSIPNFSIYEKPLRDITHKDRKFSWNAECEFAFKTLKDIITNPPILIYPDFSKDFNLSTDASGTTIGAVLSQQKEGLDLPIAFASRILSSTERRYSTIEREALAMVWAVKNFRCYLLGRKFTLYTDHKPLIHFFKITNESTRISNFKFKLSEYDFEIKHKPGKLNVVADALSRLGTQNKQKQKTLVLTRAQVHNSQDGAINPRTNANKEEVGTNSQNKYTKPQAPNSNDDSNEEFVINGEGVTPTENRKQNNKSTHLTDKEQIHSVLKSYHNTPLGGHQGVLKTYLRIRPHYRWKNMFGIIKNYVKSCKKCQMNKKNKRAIMPMMISSTSKKPFDKVFMDIVGPLPTTTRGNKFILTFEDDLTRFMDCYPLPNAEAGTVAKVFYDEIISRYRIPKLLLTDRGSNFCSDLFKKTCKFLQISKLETTAYHPQTNGALERNHGPLIEYLRSFSNDNPADWDDWLRQAMYVHNNTPHSSTKLTPMDVLFGFTSEIPSSIKKPPFPIYDHENYYYELRHKLQKAYQIAKTNLDISKVKTKEYYDKKKSPIYFQGRR